MSLSTYYLDHGRHVARLRRRRRRAYALTSNTASHDNHEKINSWVSFAVLYVFEYGAPGLVALRAAGAPLLSIFRSIKWSPAYGRLKTKENFKLLALKVVAVAYER